MIYNLKNKKEVITKLSCIFKNKSPLIISGGRTIKVILNNYKFKIYNKKILISDERLVKNSSKLRNDLIFKNLVREKRINLSQLINYKLSYLNKNELNIFSKKIEKISFMYAILSLGSNGHFASIFDVINIEKSYYFLNNSPKFPKKRVTVSLNKLSKCKKIYFLASRKNKTKEIKNFNKNSLIRKLPKKKLILLTF